MTARRILDVIADILILMALAIAGIGHFLPWAEIRVETSLQGLGIGDGDTSPEPPMRLSRSYRGHPYHYEPLPREFHLWHVVRSGAALGVAALLVGVSLVFDLRVTTRKLLVFLMFASLLAAVLFQVMIYSPYAISEVHRSLEVSSLSEREGYFLALIPSIIACALSLVRMGWTMTASPGAKLPQSD